MTPQIKQRIEHIRKGKVPEGYKKTKVGIVPAEWAETKVGNCIVEYFEKTSVKNQYPVLTSSRKGLMLQSEYYSDNQVTTEDNIGYNVIPRDYITYRSRSDDGRFRFNKNTLIDKGIISYFYPVFTFNSSVDPLFMLEMLNYTIYRQSYSFVEGTAQQVLSLKKLCSLKYSLPPLPEQEKIAEVLATQDRVIALYEKKVDELKRLKKVFLQKMFPKPGATVPEWRFPGFTGEWEKRKFKDLYDYASEGGTPDTNNPAFYEGGKIPFVKIEDTVEKYIDSPKSYITEEGMNHSSAWLIPKDSVIFTNGATVGNVAINRLPVTTKQGIIGIIPSKKVTSEFLFYLLSSTDFQREVQSRMATGTFATIILKSLNEIPVCFPPNTNEQESISTVLSGIDNLITLHQRKRDEEKQKKKALMQLLLTGIVRV